MEPGHRDDVYYVIAPNEEYGVAKGLMDGAQLREFSFRLDDPGELSSWPDLRWQLSSSDRPDIVWAARGVRLVSPLVRQVFTDLAGPMDAVQWLPSVVFDIAGEANPYWVPHFHVHHDVLDERNSTIGPSGLPIRWVLSTSKLGGLAVFTMPRLSMIYVIHERVGAALAGAGATGYTSQRARSV